MKVEICVLSGWRFSYQFDIVSETPYSCDTVSCELHFARFCGLKQTGTFPSESKVVCLFLTDFKK